MKILFLLLFALVLVISKPVLSQEIYVLKNSTSTGEVKDEIKTVIFDFMKENSVYILVKFPSSYGMNEIKFKRFVMGMPNPVMSMEVDPSASWCVYEMYIPQAGDYTFTVFDKNDVELGKANLNVVNSVH